MSEDQTTSEMTTGPSESPERPTPPIVALGASAGGLEALQELFDELPVDTGMAFVVIQHLDPVRPSMLASVLANKTKMPVIEIAAGMHADGNRVYVIPPGSDVGIRDGVFRLVPRQATRKLHLPIDVFFAALAEDEPDRAIVVVLSGTGSDGTQGLRAVKAAGGITFAQEPESAQFRGMPDSAVAGGAVDFRLPPREIAREIARLSRHPYVAPRRSIEAGIEEVDAEEGRALGAIFAELRRHAQHDFTGYKLPTIRRRIARRLALHRLDTVREYADKLHDDPAEAKALAEDILIHVTSFFRDAAVFDALKERVFPEILSHKEEDATVRVWVPGCSTGQEAYSIVICFLEVLEASARHVSIKIFASDLSAQAIETARAGVYTDSELEGVTPERLSRFFDRVEGGYRVGRRVREACVFVKHDLTREPPFARLDLISCRNVLIYFDAALQQRIIPMLHHCLSSPGYLLLGSSEGIKGSSDLFSPVDKEHRIFLKMGEGRRILYPLALGRDAEARLSIPLPPERRDPAREAQRQADHLLLARYAPPGVVVDDRLTIVQFRGHTGAFLEAPPGQPQTNLLRLARGGLSVHLHQALDTARTTSATARKEGVRLHVDGSEQRVNLEVVPLPGVPGQERYYLVLFEVAEGAARAAEPAREGGAGTAPRAPDNEEARRITDELVATRSYLQSLISEHESTADDLSATNEELIAANEELQSTVEELESAKEELQSTNEELGTVNDELRNRNRDLDEVASDLVNVLDSVEIPIIIVDRAHRVRRITPTASTVSNLIEADVGRSIDDVKLKVRIDDLPERITACIESAKPNEWEAQGLDGRWFRVRLRPYLTPDKRLDGAILSFIDVDALKRALAEAERARDYASGIVETAPTPFLVLDASLRVLSANHAYYECFATASAQTEGRGFFELAEGAWEGPVLHEAMDRSLATGTPIRDLELQRDLPKLGRRSLSISLLPIAREHGEPSMLVAIEDISAWRALEGERAQLLASEKASRIEAQQANSAKDLFLATLSHELRTPLNTILSAAQFLKHLATEDPAVKRSTGAIERAVFSQTRLIDDLLDVSRIVSGKLLLDLQAVDLATVVRGAVDVSRTSAAAKGVTLRVDVDDSIGSVYGDPVRLEQVVANLLTNSIKFTPKDGDIGVRLEKTDGQARITVTDTGIGIDPDVVPQLFERFVQADSSMTRTHGGLGLGLAIVRHLVMVHGGEVHAESAGPGRGATFVVTLPLAATCVAESAARANADAPRIATQSIKGTRVLLIDDDDDTREGLAVLLAHQGADVRTASSAAEGLASVDESKPDVILCDIAMPAEDGYTFIRKLRSLSRTRGGRIPAAALTALAGEADRRHAASAGFQAHLVKPIDVARLVAAIGLLLAGEHAQAPSQQP